jgi:hypothetical protein
MDYSNIFPSDKIRKSYSGGVDFDINNILKSNKTEISETFWSLIKLCSEKYMIAGGAPLALYIGDLSLIKDIDFFVFDKNSEDDLKNTLLNLGFKISKETKYAITLNMKDFYPVQIIKYIYPKSYEELFDTFDFTVCCCAIMDNKFFVKYPNHIYNRLLKPKNGKVTARRIKRYASKGFFPTFEIINCLINNKISTEEGEDYGDIE